ncbi:sulfurtransferase [Paraglaciecola aestuariivivens]
MQAFPNILSVSELQNLMGDPELCILFTHIDNPTAKQLPNTQHGFIWGSLEFDFEKQFCDKSSSLAHTMPSATWFEQQAQKLGINQNSKIVVYDAYGLFCAPRVWWMFKSMGHQQVAVLNGGLPAWINQGGQLQPELANCTVEGNFCAQYQANYFISAKQILEQLPQLNVLDARTAGRFKGTVPEPRAGLRSGHIPSAKNLAFAECLEKGELKAKSDLHSIFNDLNLKARQPLVFTCGSGVTACILALAACELGYKNLAVYDGSWEEWGATEDLPIEQN